jgi:hypothetical protein
LVHAAYIGKYDPLFEHLCRAGDSPLEMSFDDIEALVGALPPSSLLHRTWWGNEIGGGHVQARSWLNAGREVESVDPTQRRVRFSAPGWRRGA